MHTLARALLAEIEAFLAETGLTPTKFGLAAVNDGHLVANLRKGNSVTLKTADRVRAFIDERERAHGASASVRARRTPVGPVRGPAGNLAPASAEDPLAASVPLQRIALIIGGGIAAYKCLELIRRLREHRVGVRAIMTKAAQAFITPPSSAGRLFRDAVLALAPDHEFARTMLNTGRPSAPTDL